MRITRLDKVLPRDVADRLLAFKRDVVRALPDAVEDVVLFGSRARGDAEADSDYDLAVVLRGRLADDREIRGRVSDVVWDHMSDDVLIEAVPVNAEAFQPARTELAIRIGREGIPIR